MVGHRVGDTVAHKGQQWNFKRLRGSATGLYWYPELADSMSEFGLMAFCAVWQCWGSIASPSLKRKGSSSRLSRALRTRSSCGVPGRMFAHTQQP